MKSAPEFSIERLVERMRLGARRQTAFARTAATDKGQAGPRAQPFHRESQSESTLSQFNGPGSEPLVLQPSFKPHPDDTYHVKDLLQYHDRNFIQNAYRAVLKRGPDPTGYNSFIEGLRSGRLNKVDILARLRYSPEGRAKRVRIDGLFFPAMVRFAYQVPVVGYLLNLAVGLARLPRSIRDRQQFEAHVLSQQEQIVDHANRGNAALEALAREFSAALDRLQQSGEGLAEQQRQQLEFLTREHQQDLEFFASEQRQQVESLAHRYDQIESLAREQQQRLKSVASEQQQQIESLAREQQQQFESFAGEQRQNLSKAQAQLERLPELIAAEREESKSIQSRLREETADLERRLESHSSESQTKTELLSKELRAELARVFAKQQEIRAELVLQAQRTNLLLEKARKQLSKPRDKVYLQAMVEEADHTLDAFYLSLEEQFRGSRSEIKDRLKIYLPLITDAGIGTEQMPVLDVGCGRGEWLELLREKGLRASGIDANRLQVAQCRELGLEVIEADLLSYLRSLPESSLGAVTGFHIAEHLTIETLAAFLDETVRVVKPKGGVIFETPNPENVLVGTCNFYFDPTHRNPLPSPVLKFLLESRGFQRVQVLELNPSDEAPIEDDSDLAKRFNRYFYGPMDYAVVGWRA